METMEIEIPADAKTVTLALEERCGFTLRSLLPQISAEVELVIEDVFSEDRYHVKDRDLYRIRGSNGQMLLTSLERSRILPGAAYLALTPKVKLREPLTSLINGSFAALTGSGCIELWVRPTKKPEDD